MHDWQDLQLKVDSERQIFERIFMAIFIFISQEILPEDFCEEGDYLFVLLNHFLFLNQILMGVGKYNEKKNLCFEFLGKCLE